MRDEKKYVITENQLINFLVAEMYCEMMDRNGVENWEWYQNSYNEVLKDYYPGEIPPEEEVDFYDCAKARIEAGEFKEQLGGVEEFLDKCYIGYDLSQNI